jgi:hypothetical protein
MYHYRTKDHAEVDAVLEAPDGRIIAIEMKQGPPSGPRTLPASGISPSD